MLSFYSIFIVDFKQVNAYRETSLQCQARNQILK